MARAISLSPWWAISRPMPTSVKKSRVMVLSVRSTTTLAPATRPGTPRMTMSRERTTAPPTWNAGTRVFTDSPIQRAQSAVGTDGRCSFRKSRRQT